MRNDITNVRARMVTKHSIEFKYKISVKNADKLLFFHQTARSFFLLEPILHACRNDSGLVQPWFSP